MSPECVVCLLFVCLCDIESVLLRNHFMYQTAVNLTPCCMKHSKVLLVLRCQGSGGGGVGQNLKKGDRQYKEFLH